MTGQAAPFPERRRWSHRIALLWLAAITFYWWRHVPPIANLVIPLGPADRPWGHTADGDIVISRQLIRHNDPFNAPGGPVDIVSSVTGETLTRRIEPGDLILAWPHGGRHIAVANQHSLSIVDLDSGRNIIWSELNGASPSAVFSRDHRQVAIALDNEVTLYSLEAGTRLWTHVFTPAQYVSVAERRRDSTITARVLTIGQRILRVDLSHHFVFENSLFGENLAREFLSVDTGQPDFRFGPKDQLTESPDARLALVGSTNDRQSVFDLAEGKTLWNIPSDANWCWFSPDSSEVWDCSAIDGRPRIRRWRASDGSPLHPEDESGIRQPIDACASTDGRFIVCQTETRVIAAPDWLQRLWNTLGGNWNGVILPSEEQVLVIDRNNRSTRVFVSQSERPNWGTDLTFYALDRDRFAIAFGDCVAVYRFGAPPVFFWLLTRGVAPVVLIYGWRWLRRRKYVPGQIPN